MDVKIFQGNEEVNLCGSAVVAPLRAGAYEPSAAASWEEQAAGASAPPETGQRLEEVRLSLEGSAAVIFDFTVGLERLLLQAEAAYGIPGQQGVYLQVTTPEGAAYRSPLVKGWLVYGRGGPGARSRGAQGISVCLVRADFWESTALVEIPLSNCHGSGVSGGLQVDNHFSTASGYDNTVYWQAYQMNGVFSLLSPAVLSIEKPTTPGLEVMVAHNVHADPLNDVPQVETDTGTPGSGVTASLQSAADASGGTYRSLNWSGLGAMMLLYFTLGAEWTRQAAGGLYRPVLRMQSPVGSNEKLWLWLRASYWNGTLLETLAEGEPQLADSANRLVLFPPMHLPPWASTPGSIPAQALTLELCARHEASGAHSLGVDFIQLLPLDSWARYLPVIGSMAGLNLVEDFSSGVITRSDLQVQTHYREGPGIWLAPNRSQRLYFLMRSGQMMDIKATALVRLQVRPRVRNL